MPTSTISQHLLPMSTPVVTVVENDTNAQTSKLQSQLMLLHLIFVLII